MSNYLRRKLRRRQSPSIKPPKLEPMPTFPPPSENPEIAALYNLDFGLRCKGILNECLSMAEAYLERKNNKKAREHLARIQQELALLESFLLLTGEDSEL